MTDIQQNTHVHAGWTFTQAACLALRGHGINLTSMETRKGFSIPNALLVMAGVRYVRGTPETKGLLTK